VYLEKNYGRFAECYLAKLIFDIIMRFQNEQLRDFNVCKKRYQRDPINNMKRTGDIISLVQETLGIMLYMKSHNFIKYKVRDKTRQICE